MAESPRNIDQLQAELDEARWQLRIEAALDRLRTAVSKMTLSSELLDIVTIMSKEFSGLGLETIQITNCRLMPDGYMVSATKIGGSKTQFEHTWPFDGNPIEKGMRAWLVSDDPVVVFEYTPELASEHMVFLKTRTDFFELDPDAQGDTKSRVEIDGFFMIFARTASGAITNITWDAPSQKSLDVLVKFARAFDLAYARFEDLQKAEAQTREAQIEASLERARSRTMAMLDSEELESVTLTFVDLLTDLGMPVQWAGMVLHDPDDDTWTLRLAYSQSYEIVRLRGHVFTIPMPPISDDPTFQAWESGERVRQTHISREELPEWMETYRIIYESTGHNPEEVLAMYPDGFYRIDAYMKHGLFGGGAAKPFTDEQIEIQDRFAREFERTYRRFLDLKKAEAQTREAQIEAALERIRSRSMAMQSSDELHELSFELVKQVQALGVDTWHCAFNIYDEGQESSTEWGANADGIYPIYKTPRVGIFKRYYEIGQTGKSLHVEEIGEDRCEMHYEFLCTLPGVGDELRRLRDEGIPFPTSQVDHVAFFRYGYLLFITYEPVPEAHGIFKRFAAVFEQTYTRFLDLQQAEAQAREAQIEAALERVRAQAMSMQTSEDIGQTALFLFSEIPELCPSVLRVGLGIMEGPDEMEGWLAGSDAEGNVGIVKGTLIRRGDRPETDNMMDSWVSGNSCSFLESEDFLVWARDVAYSNTDLSIISIEMSSEQHVTTFTHNNGVLYVISGAGLTPKMGDGAIIQRFAGVFDLAYQRYHDLAQAESDYKALLAEKALTEETLSALQTTQAQLIESEKLASLGALTAGIAHEIKNPLNFVNNFAEVSSEMSQEIIDALAAGDLDEARDIAGELATNSDQIAKHGKRADSIVKSMMQHARGGASELETIQVNDYLEEYINLAWHGMRARDDSFTADVNRDFDPAVGSITAMPQELGRVILNLLNNAFDALRETENATIIVATRSLAGAVEIIISDNGPGIPSEIREKIFEPFFTTKATGEGTGLGLSLSHDIVTKGHGGSMKVEKSATGGASFVLTLPIKAHA